ncbi:MAG TPA: MBL fold metallo-hydrolase [Steroidobacteraceae bacterium]|nr:MBL fold metallo-hydrolase [Steroidobacteraceae bacterium]
MMRSVPDVHAFFDPATHTVSYVVSDPRTRQCAIIDSVLDYDPKSGRTSTHSAAQIVGYVQRQGLQTQWILETHAHADHLSAAQYLKERLGGSIAIGERIRDVQRIFGKVFNIEAQLPPDGSQFDRLFRDGDTFLIGEISARVMHTPGHTPGCVTYVAGDVAFVGDTLFMPDYGTARVDFPGGDARTLFRSIQSILALPPETRLFMCHDYGAPGRTTFAWETTVEEERRSNIHVKAGTDEDAFVLLRTRRDATLEMPVLLLPSVQVNIRAGHLPPPEGNGVRYLKIPLDAL